MYVRVMERRPPPAPARAWATLSVCCDTAVGWAIAVNDGREDTEGESCRIE